MSNTLTFKLRDWTGPAGRTLIQGVKWDGTRFIISQADDVGTDVEDVVLREHAADLSYTGKSQTLKQAGHGSSWGLEPTAGGTRVWIGHKLLGVGFYLFGEDHFEKVGGIPNGDVAVDADHDLLCVRVGNRYRGYTLSSVEAGKPKALFDQGIPAWGKRFQGHAITKLADGNVYLLTHRDVETNGDSQVNWFKAAGGKLVLSGTYNTRSPKGEAEGVLLFDGSVWSVKRLGGNNADRTVHAVRMALDVLKKSDEVDVIHDSSKNWTESVRKAALEVDNKFPRSEWTSTYPGHGEGSAKGAYAVDFMCNKSDGDKIAAYVWSNRKRLGVRYVIWYKKIISETSSTPNRWVTYFNAGSSNPSKAHTNHVHVSFYTNRDYTPPASVKVEPVAKLPVFVVDPEKVSTTLIANAPAGKNDLERAPGFRVTTAKEIDGDWLVTESGYRYHKDFMVEESVFKARPVVEPVKPPVTHEPVPPVVVAPPVVTPPPVSAPVDAVLAALLASVDQVKLAEALKAAGVKVQA